MAVEFKDYYQTLGVARDAGDEAIKKAFRKLARQFHPDVAQDKQAAEARFKEINEAYEVLSDPVKRRKYDRLGARWREEAAEGQPPPSWEAAGGQEFHFGGTGFSDFFEQFFGGGRYGFQPGDTAEFHGATRGGGRARRGGDVEGDILVTLEEAMHGTLRSISMQRLNRQTGQAEIQEFQVRIPPGATDGRRIRVPGHGEPGLGGAPAGDLYLRVRHAAHPDFTTRAADLLHELDVAPWELVLGAEVIVPTLDGSIKLRIPAGSQPGQQLRVRGRGLPRDKSGERGDFYVTLNVQFPAAPGPAQRELWEKLRDTSEFHPRSS